MTSLHDNDRSAVLPGTGALVKELQEGQILKNVAFSGTSMRPMLRQNVDAVDLIKPSQRLRIYDVPLYTGPNGKYVMHRIIAVKDDGYICRGDNTYRPERVSQDQIVAVVCAFRRGQRHIGVESGFYRLYCRFWCGVYPLRKLICRIKWRLKRRKKSK